MVVKQYTLLSI